MNTFCQKKKRVSPSLNLALFCHGHKRFGHGISAKGCKKNIFLDSLPRLLHQRVYALLGVAFTFNAIQHLNSHLNEIAISSVFSTVFSSAKPSQAKMIWRHGRESHMEISQRAGWASLCSKPHGKLPGFENGGN